jgi:hypothetical protein
VFTDQRGGLLRNSNWRARVFSAAVTACQKADDSFPSITPHDWTAPPPALYWMEGGRVLERKIWQRGLA